MLSQLLGFATKNHNLGKSKKAGLMNPKCLLVPKYYTFSTKDSLKISFYK